MVVWMIGTNVVRAWFAFASRSALIWCDKRQRWSKVLWLTATPTLICMHSSALPVLEVGKVASKVTQEASLCDSNNLDGINRRCRGHLLNLEVTPVTRNGNSAYLETIGSKKSYRWADKAEKAQSSDRILLLLYIRFILLSRNTNNVTKERLPGTHVLVFPPLRGLCHVLFSPGSNSQNQHCCLLSVNHVVTLQVWKLPTITHKCTFVDANVHADKHGLREAWKPSCKHYRTRMWPQRSLSPSHGRRDNIKIHEERGGSPSVTPKTVLAGAAQALNSCLLYTRVQAGWNMRAGDTRSSQNAKLSLLPSTSYLSPSSPSTVPCNQSDA